MSLFPLENAPGVSVPSLSRLHSTKPCLPLTWSLVAIEPCSYGYRSRDYCVCDSAPPTLVRHPADIIHSAEALQHGQEVADQKPHLYGATINDDNVAGAHVTLEKEHGAVASSSDSVSIVVEDDGIGGIRPTAEEMATLRKVGEPLPKSAFLVAIVELCERFTYYGASGIFQNYIARPRSGVDGRGALGMGHQGATGLSTFFQFWCYVTPILGAVIADQYLGKYNTIVIFCCVYIVGLLVLTLTSLPAALDHGAGLGGFIVAVIIIGLGTGGIKSNVAPLIADQYKRRQMVIGKDDKTGERVIIDPAITIQRIYMVSIIDSCPARNIANSRRSSTGVSTLDLSPCLPPHTWSVTLTSGRLTSCVSASSSSVFLFSFSAARSTSSDHLKDLSSLTPSVQCG